ncbi:MAG: hypothetical protein IIC46_14100 [Planctomycetes bacterium]|nr:hypothetical protein [Planctomycetota bacterium]
MTRNASPAADGAQETTGLGNLAGVRLDRLERVRAIRQTLAMPGGNREHAAQLLGIGERTPYHSSRSAGFDKGRQPPLKAPTKLDNSSRRAKRQPRLP